MKVFWPQNNPIYHNTSFVNKHVYMVFPFFLTGNSTSGHKGKEVELLSISKVAVELQTFDDVTKLAPSERGRLKCLSRVSTGLRPNRGVGLVGSKTVPKTTSRSKVTNYTPSGSVLGDQFHRVSALCSYYVRGWVCAMILRRITDIDRRQ